MSRKTTISTFSFTIIFILSVLLTGCKKKNQKEISTTPILPPTHGPVITLDSLKHWYYMNCGPNDTLRITNDFTIEGIVVSNDKSGNIYKTLYIQDSTGGITLLLDQVNLFNLFPPGHKVFVKCKDLYFGTDGSFIKLGSLFYGHVGMIPSDKIQSHVYPDGLPDQPFQPKRLVLDSLTSTELHLEIATLVSLPGVKFWNAGEPFINPGDVNTHRYITDSSGNYSHLIILNTYQRANFSASLLPSGIGTVQGILSFYDGKYELLVRDTTDLINFHAVNK